MSFLTTLNLPQNIINEINRPLSLTEIKKKIPEINIIQYANLNKFKNIDEVIGKNGGCIILYMTGPTFGHWVLLMKRNKNTLEFFDAYGITIDDELNFSNFHQGVQTPSLHYLTRMIINSEYTNVICSSTQLQVQNNNIQTCGRWLIVRWMLKHMDIDSFINLFLLMDWKIRDLFITLITIND